VGESLGNDHETGDAPAPDLDLVEFLVITTSSLSALTSVARSLRELVESSRLRILDLVGVETDPLGSYTTVEVESVSGLVELQGVDGEVGGLLSEDDIALACRALAPGTSALILVAEDRWAQHLADAARAGGGRIAGGERIPRHRVEQTQRARARHHEETTGD
jgi:hypothetical protein